MASTFTSLTYHVVFSTKDRRKLIAADWSDDLHACMGGIAGADGGSLRSAGGVEDHVHLLLERKPGVPLSQLVGRIKANNSKWLNKQGRVAVRFEWQRGYSAFSVSRFAWPAVRLYIDSQREHHATASFRDDLVALLKSHGIDLDERYLLGRVPVAASRLDQMSNMILKLSPQATSLRRLAAWQPGTPCCGEMKQAPPGNLTTR